MRAILFSVRCLFSHFSCVYLLKAVMKSLMRNAGTRLVAVCYGSLALSSQTLRCPFTSVFCWLASPFASLGWTAWWDWCHSVAFTGHRIDSHGDLYITRMSLTGVVTSERWVYLYDFSFQQKQHFFQAGCMWRLKNIVRIETLQPSMIWKPKIERWRERKGLCIYMLRAGAE